MLGFRFLGEIVDEALKPRRSNCHRSTVIGQLVGRVSRTTCALQHSHRLAEEAFLKEFYQERTHERSSYGLTPGG
jgi:hypothetical protein